MLDLVVTVASVNRVDLMVEGGSLAVVRIGLAYSWVAVVLGLDVSAGVVARSLLVV